MGAVAALLAGACVAPVVIQVVLFSSNLYATGTKIALALPFCLGIGMAIPWPIAGAGLAALPKPGMWMVRVKQAFGVFILATAAYYGYEAYSIFSNRWVDPAAVASSVQEQLKAGWHASLAEGLAAAQREKKPVLIDMWATWCKNCLTMDKTTLASAEVQRGAGRLREDQVPGGRSRRAAGQSVMQRFNAVGLPTYVILRPSKHATDHADSSHDSAAARAPARGLRRTLLNPRSHVIRGYLQPRDALRRDFNDASPAKSASTRSRARSTPPTPASTRSSRSASSCRARARTSSRASRSPRRHGVPITARGGGTSQAGQAIGAGLQLDTSKYLNRILEVNVAERWAWVEPGVVLDELNAQLRPHGLRFAPDISTASRATIGGMIANNSSGARSVLYGKTIDHVLELQVVLADGIASRISRPLDADGARDGVLPATRSRRAAIAPSARLAQRCRDEIERRFPKVLRRVGGYNLDEFVDRSKPFNLAKLDRRLRGHARRWSSRRRSIWCRCRAAKAVLTIEFDELLDALGATPLILRHRPSAVEVMDRLHPRSRARKARRSTRCGAASSQAEPGALLCVEFYGDRARRICRRGSRRSSATSPRPAMRCHRARDRAGRPGAHLEPARSGARAVDGDEGRRQVALVRRGHGRRAGKAARLHRRFLQIVRRHGTSAGVYAHASVGCLHVRPVVNLKTADGVARFEAIANDVADLVLEFGGALSGEHGDGLVRGPFTREDVRPGALPGVPRP